jgi:hypothetical protein
LSKRSGGLRAATCLLSPLCRFKAKIGETLKPHSGVSLFKTLQKLRNLILGWGKYYRSMRVNEIYPALDKFIQKSVRGYLRESGIVLIDKKWQRQRKFLAIPSLTSMAEHVNETSKPVAKAAAASQCGSMVTTQNPPLPSDINVGAA